MKTDTLGHLVGFIGGFLVYKNNKIWIHLLKLIINLFKFNIYEDSIIFKMLYTYIYIYLFEHIFILFYYLYNRAYLFICNNSSKQNINNTILKIELF